MKGWNPSPSVMQSQLLTMQVVSKSVMPCSVLELRDTIFYQPYYPSKAGIHSLDLIQVTQPSTSLNHFIVREYMRI